MATNLSSVQFSHKITIDKGLYDRLYVDSMDF